MATDPSSPPTIQLPESLSFFQGVVDQFVSMGKSVEALIPTLVIAICVLGLGFIIAKVLRSIITRAADKLNFDALAEKVGLTEQFAKLGIRPPLGPIVGKLIFAFIIIYFVKSAADIAGVKDISQFINDFIAFLPKLLISVFILFGGLMAADILKGALESKMEAIEFSHGGLIARFVHILFILMIATVVLNQLGIETDLLSSTVKIFLAGLSLLIALALGFGLRPIARNVVSGVYARDVFQIGSSVILDSGEFKVVEVGTVSTRLENEIGDYVVIPNSALMSRMTSGHTEYYSEKKLS